VDGVALATGHWTAFQVSGASPPDKDNNTRVGYRAQPQIHFAQHTSMCWAKAAQPFLVSACWAEPRRVARTAHLG
jgi:hypothetical protein